jgi:DNA-binding NarL/FixJ family response regulator
MVLLAKHCQLCYISSDRFPLCFTGDENVATSKIRVLLVDDESLVRRILKELLASHADVDLVGEAATGYEAIAAVDKLHPDIVVMDIRMPGLDGIAAAREIRAKYTSVKIIGLSEYAYGYNTHAMERAGAVGVYQKSSAIEELYPAIKKARGHGSPGESEERLS